jgi:hypothetical protein
MKRLSVNAAGDLDVFKVRMNNLPSIFHKGNRQGSASDNRLLRKLRIALLLWLIILLVTIVWFTNSPAF